MNPVDPEAEKPIQRRIPDCHPDRRHYARGLCKPCHDRDTGRIHGGKPGQILCNSTATRTGAPCGRWRDLDKQCKLHPRSLDELEKIAREHCLLTGESLPSSFGSTVDKIEAERQAWLVEFKLLGCRPGMSREAARRAGIPEAEVKQFAYHAHKAMQAEISAWMDEQAMPANEAVALLARIARNEVSEYYTTGELDPKLEQYLKAGIKAGKIDPDIAERAMSAITDVTLDAAKLVRDGNGDLITAIKRTREGLVYETGDRDAALRDIIEIHGLKKQKVEHTGKDGGPIDIISAMTPEQQAQAMIDLIAKGRANLSDNSE